MRCCRWSPRSQRNLYDGIGEGELALASVMAARTLVEQEPNYAYVSARLLLDKLRDRGADLRAMARRPARRRPTWPRATANTFPAYIKTGIKAELLDPDLAPLRPEKLAAALKPERDLAFQLLGLQTLYDRYFLHDHGTDTSCRRRSSCGWRWASPCGRSTGRPGRSSSTVALVLRLHVLDADPVQRRHHPAAALVLLPDHRLGRSRRHLPAFKDNALLAKYSGGLGNDWTRVRGLGAHIKGTNGRARASCRSSKSRTTRRSRSTRAASARARSAPISKRGTSTSRSSSTCARTPATTAAARTT